MVIMGLLEEGESYVELTLVLEMTSTSSQVLRWK
jgi:hypothetical protein